MLDPYSQIEKALRDTLVRFAEGPALFDLARFHGMNLPHNGYPEKSVRKALEAVAYGARGTFGCVLGFIEGILDHLKQTFQVTTDPIQPNKIFTTGVGVTNTITMTNAADYVGTWIRVQDPALYPNDPLPKLYYCTGLGGPTSSPDEIELSQFETSYWSKANFTTTSITEATFLPFFITEPTPGRDITGGGIDLSKYLDLPCKIVLYGAGFAGLGVPPTYIEDYTTPPGSAADTQRAAGTPYGGIIMPDATEIGGGGSESSSPTASPGPYPLYFSAGEAVQFLIENTVEPMLAAGVDILPGYKTEKTQVWAGWDQNDWTKDQLITIPDFGDYGFGYDPGSNEI